jgi:hypothetical protein
MQYTINKSFSPLEERIQDNEVMSALVDWQMLRENYNWTGMILCLSYAE